jgi:hypothetical protein
MSAAPGKSWRATAGFPGMLGAARWFVIERRNLSGAADGALRSRNGVRQSL